MKTPKLFVDEVNKKVFRIFGGATNHPI